MIGFMEFFGLYHLLREVGLTEKEDQHVWKFDVSGVYSAINRPIELIFNGLLSIFEPWRPIWKSCALVKCMISIWLVVRNRCWMVDHLAHPGYHRI